MLSYLISLLGGNLPHSLSVVLFSLLAQSLLLNSAWAQSDQDNSFFNYESIVSELSSSKTQSNPSNYDPFADVRIHAGVGLVSSLISLQTFDGDRFSGFQNGFEANLGIDLFSPLWMAEGAIRRYSVSELDRSTSSALHEFNLKIIYRTPASRSLKLHFGFGLAARFLELKRKIQNQVQNEEHSTPSSILSIGLESPLSRELSLGVELGYRSAMVRDTIDRSAMDASLKLAAHF